MCLFKRYIHILNYVHDCVSVHEDVCLNMGAHKGQKSLSDPLEWVMGDCELPDTCAWTRAQVLYWSSTHPQSLSDHCYRSSFWALNGELLKCLLCGLSKK